MDVKDTNTEVTASALARVLSVAVPIALTLMRQVPSCLLRALGSQSDELAVVDVSVLSDAGRGLPIFISVIIPCYNEEEHIVATVESALADEDAEVIVSDGGSSDETVARLQRFLGSGRVRLVTGGKSRSQSQNIGAAAVEHSEGRASVLLFLHADSVLPTGYGHMIRGALEGEEPRYCAGAFSFKLDRVGSEASLPFSLRLIEWGTNWRARRFSLPYGDQALFIRRPVFDALGGFADVSLLEDIELVVALSRCKGALCMLDAPVVTSGRRWRLFGAAGITFMNQIVLLGWRMGVPHADLARWYYGMASCGRKCY